jgi:hypothetical protein
MDPVVVALSLVGLALKVWALIDVTRRSDAAFRAADRLTRTIWIVVLAAAIALQLWVGGGSWGGIMGTVVAALYLIETRPRVARAEREPT